MLDTIPCRLRNQDPPTSRRNGLCAGARPVCRPANEIPEPEEARCEADRYEGQRVHRRVSA